MQIMYKKDVSLNKDKPYFYRDKKYTGYFKATEVLVACYKSSTRENAVHVLKSLCNVPPA